MKILPIIILEIHLSHILRLMKIVFTNYKPSRIGVIDFQEIFYVCCTHSLSSLPFRTECHSFTLPILRYLH